MRQIVYVEAGTGTSKAIPLDTYISPFQVNVGISVSDDAEYAIQYTVDNVFDPNITATWYNVPSNVYPDDALLQENGDFLLQENDGEILTGDENVNAYIDYPVSAVRLNTSTNTGTVTMTVLQAGRPG